MSEFRREIAPADALEDRIVAALRSRSLLRRSTGWWLGRGALAAAAAILLVAGGYVAGASQSRPAGPAGPAQPRFMLLLHETDATAAIGVSEDVLVNEYREWAQRIAAGGHRITGEKLVDEPGETLSGFFIVEAPSFDAARDIAESSPHVRHGGRIEIREIDPL